MMRFLWLDLETTGLNPNRDVVLEVAAVLTGQDFEPIDKFHAVVYRDPDFLKGLNIDNYVIQMHSVNGLWKAVSSGDSALTVSTALDRFARRNHCYVGNRMREPARIAGNSVHFDRRFLESFAPEFHRNMHHQHIDVSCLLNGLKAWKPGGITWPKGSTHRAMDDVLFSIEQAKLFQKAVSCGPLFGV